MKLVVIYRPNSDTARSVETFVHDFEHRHEGLGRRIEVLSTETRDGSAMMSLYDIMETPAIMVLGEDSQLIHHWTGPTLPLMDEVASYFYTA